MLAQLMMWIKTKSSQNWRERSKKSLAEPQRGANYFPAGAAAAGAAAGAPGILPCDSTMRRAR